MKVFIISGDFHSVLICITVNNWAITPILHNIILLMCCIISDEPETINVLVIIWPWCDKPILWNAGRVSCLLIYPKIQSKVLVREKLSFVPLWMEEGIWRFTADPSDAVCLVGLVSIAFLTSLWWRLNQSLSPSWLRTHI